MEGRMEDEMKRTTDGKDDRRKPTKPPILYIEIET
jgi:hypothetical protein